MSAENGVPKLPGLPGLGKALMQERVSPLQIFAGYTGLSMMQLEWLGATVEPCLCGRCQGVRVVLNRALHATAQGVPEFFVRPEPPAPSPTDRSAT